jgi:ketosteroid isomerase-like protein
MTTANVQIVKGIYDAFTRGDMGALVAVLSPQVVWNVAESYPYAAESPYIGPDAVLRELAMLSRDWNGFAVRITEVLDAGDKVVAIGRYTGTCKKTGKSIDAQTIHVVTIAGGKITAFQQYTDTYQIRHAMQP